MAWQDDWRPHDPCKKSEFMTRFENDPLFRLCVQVAMCSPFGWALLAGKPDPEARQLAQQAQLEYLMTGVAR